MIRRASQVAVLYALRGRRISPNLGSLYTYPARRCKPGLHATYSSGADEDDDEELEEDEEDGDEDMKPVPHGTKVPFKRFKQKLHIQFLATPFAVPNQFMGRKKGAVDNLPKEFVRLYFVLYFTMAFLVRARRNNRYFGYLRKLRSERMAMAEVLPGNIGITSEAFGADIINLHMKKYEYLSKGLSGHLNNMNQELSQLRDYMQQAGNPEANPVTYRNLTQNLLLSLHAYDTVYHMDQFRPGPQGHLVPQRVRPPVPRPVRDQVVQQEPPPFLFKRKQVVMYEALEDADAVDGDTEEGDPAGAAPKGVNYRVLGTLPNVMPRRQTLAFYELYRSLKREGKLPAELHNNPYRAMQGFYKHWVSWALTRQKEIHEVQRTRYSKTMEMASRMVRHHQGISRGRMLQSILGTKGSGNLMSDMWAYRLAVLEFYEKTLTKYTDFNDDIYRMLAGQREHSETPAELFDTIWRTVFQSKERILSWRMNRMRRKFVRLNYQKDLKRTMDRRGQALQNEKALLRHYYLIKTILSMSMSGERNQMHPSKQLAMIRTQILTILYEMLLPSARLVNHLERQPRKPRWATAVHELGTKKEDVMPGPRAQAKVPKGEVATERRTVERYPVCGYNGAAYVQQLQQYRRNHLLRTRTLGLNFSPRGPAAVAQSRQ